MIQLVVVFVTLAQIPGFSVVKLVSGIIMTFEMSFRICEAKICSSHDGQYHMLLCQFRFYVNFDMQMYL